jgi:formate hydrogenlyase subunit 4
MNAAYPYILELFQAALLVIAAPLFVGWIRTLKCWAQGRTSPGLFRPYADVFKYFSKETVLAENASWIFVFTPYLVFGVTVLAAGIVPLVAIDLPFAATADVIALVALFALARFFTALAGMDIGTAFGGMGSSREMMISSLAEPAMLMTILVTSLATGSTSLAQMASVTAASPLVLRPSLAFALLAFIFVALAETGRVPIDNPVTHLELTMVHEGMILEYSGKLLALVEWAGMMKLYLYSSLAIALFAPWGLMSGFSLAGFLWAIFAHAVKLMCIGAFIVAVETGIAKMRIFRVPEFLGAAFVFATLGLLSYFMLG